ncbi:MAG: hypothetical protein ACI9FJ_002654 [Alteromonadaceae bacterium]|jgi:hypothetical protein
MAQYYLIKWTGAHWLSLTELVDDKANAPFDFHLSPFWGIVGMLMQFWVSSLSRFTFYIAIGLGSWVGAALVEKRLDKVI